MGGGLTRVSIGHDLIVLKGLYVTKTLLSGLETRSVQRRVVMVSFIYNFRLKTLLFIVFVIVFYNGVLSLTGRSSSCHVCRDSKQTSPSSDEGKSS